MKTPKRIKNGPLVTNLLSGAAVLVIVTILARPQVTAATAVKVNFMPCMAVANRGLRAPLNKPFTFRVVTETDDTFLMEDFGIRQPMKAGRPHFFTITSTEPRWYGFKLKSCGYAGGAVVGLKADGSDSSMGNMRYMHSSRQSDGGHDTSGHE